MVYKPIIVVAGEPNSIFNEIFFKSLKKKIQKSNHINCITKYNQTPNEETEYL